MWRGVVADGKWQIMTWQGVVAIVVSKVGRQRGAGGGGDMTWVVAVSACRVHRI